MTTTFHPCSISAVSFRASRDTFASNFGIQYSVLLPGVVARLQPACLCQKQPCTNIARRCRGSTTSGVPGRSFLCNRKRYPSACNARRTAISGEVSRCLTDRINALLRSEDSLSIRRSRCLRRSASGSHRVAMLQILSFDRSDHLSADPERLTTRGVTKRRSSAQVNSCAPSSAEDFGISQSNPYTRRRTQASRE